VLRVKVKYMMWLRDKVGLDVEEYLLEHQPRLAELLEIIRQRHASIARLLENIESVENPIIMLVNGVKQSTDYVLRDGDEVVFLPPVSGG